MPDTPLILAFDTSAAHCAAALLSGTRIVAEAHEDMTRGQAERLMPLLQDVLKAGGVAWGDLTRIGVGIGPGNFTGIRISVSAARGLALGLAIPAIGVSSLDALKDRHGRSSGIARDDLIASVDARGGKVYLDWGAGPMLADLDTLPDLPNGAVCIGFAAETLAAQCGGTTRAPMHPIAHAIAHIAARRTPGPRPAPLYIRAPDAAPARPAPPVA